MITVSLRDEKSVRLAGDDCDLRKVRDRFSPLTEGHWFNPRFKAGFWDGRVKFFNAQTGAFPIRLLDELFQACAQLNISVYCPNELLEPTPKVSVVGIPILDLTLRSYQKDAITALLQRPHGIAQVATGGGKAFTIISLIGGVAISTGGNALPALIIVPRKQLVEQFYKEFEKAGWNRHPELKEFSVGRVHGEVKEFDRNVVISTWQSLNSLPDKELQLQQFRTVVVDEVHSAKAYVLSKLLELCPAERRYGFTGTMPSNAADKFNVIKELGPVRFVKTADELMQMDVLSQVHIKQIHLMWADKKFESFQDERKWLEANHTRNRILTGMALACSKDQNVLILVEKLAHGAALLENVNTSPSVKRKAVFIQGKTELEEREELRKAVDTETGVVIIATYGVFSTGVDVHNLHSIIFAIPGKSEIRTIQSIGRGLRTAEGKDKLTLIDVVDNVKYSLKHAKLRQKIYDGQNFPFKVIKITSEELDKFKPME